MRSTWSTTPGWPTTSCRARRAPPPRPAAPSRPPTPPPSTAPPRPSRPARTPAANLANGGSDILGRGLRYNFGVRYVTTDQEVSGPVTIGGNRVWQTQEGDYSEWLPSFSAAWDVTDNVVLRTSASRTMTRPNP